MEEVMQFLTDAGGYYIASVDSEGKPHVRPFGSRYLVDGKFYISMSFPKNVYDQVMANPYVEIATMGKDRSWLRIAAKAVPVLDLEARKKILEASPGGGGPRNPETQMLFELTEVTATINQGQNQKVINW